MFQYVGLNVHDGDESENNARNKWVKPLFNTPLTQSQTLLRIEYTAKQKAKK